MKDSKTRTAFFQGVRDGIPIALGYFAVAFSLGIAARNAGLTPFQGFFASTLCVASAGEYALFTLIGAGATYLEVAVLTLITNARYFLMSCALSQRISPDMKNYHRLLIGAVVTDEIFGITIARPGQSHALRNEKDEPLVFLDIIAQNDTYKANHPETEKK